MLIRYPGSKRKLAKEIIRRFPSEMQHPLWMKGWEYREPFFGAGAIGFEILQRLPPGCSAWINDLDFGIASLWASVKQSPDELVYRIRKHKPSLETYREFLESDGLVRDPVEAGFRKLVLHQQSYSGLGNMAGSPLGGWGQDNMLYRIDCRWNPESLTAQVYRLSRLMTSVGVKVTCKDFSACSEPNAKSVFYYLDPPYVMKGQQLYKHAMGASDHTRLRDWVQRLKGTWVVSYDDCALIRRLYRRGIGTIVTAYSIAGVHRKNNELLITAAEPMNS